MPACDPSAARAPLSLTEMLENRPFWEDVLRHDSPGASTVVAEAITTATHLDDNTTADVAKLVRWLPQPERERVLGIWPQLTDLLDD